MSVRVGSLWVNKSNDKEETFISGYTGPVIIPQNSRIYLNKNKDKQNEKAPDFFLDVVIPRSKEKENYGQQQQSSNSNEDLPF